MSKVKDYYESQKIQDLKLRISQKIHRGKDWIMDNKEAIIVLTPIVVGVATPIVKSVNKHITLNKAKDLKNLYCYDRSLGHYWSLRRELTNNEWITIDRRKKCGERLADILADMRVLK